MFSEIKNVFIVAFILGACLSLYGAYSGLYLITVSLSVLIMVVYFFTTLYLNTIKKQISVEQLANSNYYLGFMFTLVSILVSLTSVISNSYNIDNIVSNFGVSLVTTIIGLLARIYLANFMPNEEVNNEILNESVAHKIRIMNDLLLDNMQKNKAFSQMIDERMEVLVVSTERSLGKFTKLLDKDFKASIDTFNASIKSITKSMETSNKKQSALISEEVKEVKEVKKIKNKNMKPLCGNKKKL